jgi:hypothetical protein
VSQYRSKDVLNVLAKLAADGYLKSQTPLNEGVAKIAEQESLTPAQVEYVAAESNKSVWRRLFSMDKEASYDFPLADSAEIISKLQVEHKPKTVKEIDLDYLSPPINTKLAEFNPMKAMGFKDEVFEKQASTLARKELKHELQARYEKLAFAKEELYRLDLETSTKIENLEVQFVKTARALVLEESFEDRGMAFEKIAEFLRGCEGKMEYKLGLMKKLAHVAVKQGIVKEADLKAPEQYISDKLPARIINGNHSLYITIKTLFDNYDYHNGIREKSLIVDGSLPVVKEKIREL